MSLILFTIYKRTSREYIYTCIHMSIKDILVLILYTLKPPAMCFLSEGSAAGERRRRDGGGGGGEERTSLRAGRRSESGVHRTRAASQV